MSWNNVNKPTGNNYSYVNPMGKESYDQADIEYDSATTYYDGINPNQYTNIAKPTTNNWQDINKPT